MTKMTRGVVGCGCGNHFYYETIFEEVTCIKCKAKHSTASGEVFEYIQEESEEETPAEE